MIAALFAKLALGRALGAVAGFFVTLVKSLFESLSALISSPAAWFAVIVLFGVGYGLGINRGMWIDGKLVEAARADRDQWKAAHNKLVEDAEKLDAENKDKLKSALAAGAAAEKAERAKAGPAAAPAAAGVRKPAKRAAAKNQDSDSGSWLFPIQTLFWQPVAPGKK